MKTGIIIAMAALSMAIFAVPDAQAWWWHHGPDLNLRLSGSNFVTSSTDGAPTPLTGEVLTSMANGIAKGKHGRSLFTAQAILDMVPENPAEFPPECLAMGMAGSGVSVTTVFTYNDGSILSIVTDPALSFFCTDGVAFTVEFAGTVSGGSGRFDGAAGSWAGTAESTGGRVTSHVMIDLD